VETKNELSRLLKNNHRKINGCWQTNYSAIANLTVLSATTNGTSGIVQYCGKKLYFYEHKGEFYVERYASRRENGR